MSSPLGALRAPALAGRIVAVTALLLVSGAVSVSSAGAVTTEPGDSQSGATQSGATQPGATQSGDTQSGATQSGDTQPGNSGDSTATDAGTLQCATDPALPKRQLRAMWIASVANLDWPSSSGLSAAQQQAEYRAQLDLAEEHQLNTVIVQIRPTADAFWPSPYEPWSHWLTGSQGSDPGYDPLEFMIEETHARGLEFHAWFNPYRVATHDNLSQLHPEHPARRNADWAFSYGGQLYYDPGVPAVREHVTAAMMHAVSNYNLDGVHWDDYFYPYPSGSTPIPDQDTFAQYGGGFTDIDDWRRNNVDLLVESMGEQITAEKPQVKFGVSPFGIWRNQSTDPLGSATNGLQSYDAIYADTRRWVTEEWVDYVVPQIYWPIGFAAADYSVLVPWWSDVVAGTQVQLFVGQATYRAGAAGEDPAWQRPSVLSDLLTLNQDYPEVLGDVHFSAKDVRANRIGAMSRLVADHYVRPALVPIADHLGGAVPGTPSGLTAGAAGGEAKLSWQPVSGARGYAVYRLDGESSGVDPCDFADARHLLGTTGETSFTDPSAAAGTTYTYHVAALDRLHHESDPSAGAVVNGDGGGDGFETIMDTTSDRFHAGSGWGVSSFSPQAYGDSYRFAEPVADSDPAWYQIEVPAAGSYRVEVWYPADPGYHAATPYLVATTSGLQTVPVDQRTGGGQWVELGTFTLAEGDYDVVGVSRWATGSGYVVADAVRITRV